MIDISKSVFKWIMKPRSFFLIQLLFFVIIFAAAFHVEYKHFMNTTKDTIKSNNETAEQLSKLIMNHQQAIIGIIRSYGTKRSLINAVKERDAEAMTIHFVNMRKNMPDLDIVFIADTSAVLWANYPKQSGSVGKSFSHRDWYIGTSRQWKPYVSGVYKRIVRSKDLVVAIAVPVFDEREKPIGILGASQAAVFIKDVIQGSVKDETLKVTLIDQSGNIIYSSTMADQNEIIKYAYPISGDTIAAYKSVQPNMWTIIVEKEKKDIFSSVSGHFLHAGITSAVLYLFIGLTLVLIRKYVVFEQAFILLSAEERVRESEEKYRSIFENIVEGIFQTTPEGHFISVNPAMARIHGFSSPEEMVTSITNIGKQLYLNPEDRKRYQEILQKSGTVRNFEAQVYRKDGNTIWTSTSSYAVKNAAGKMLRFEGIVEDITERKQVEDNLRKSLVGTIQVISLMLEIRDPYTAGHQKRVSSLARSIAQEMNLSNDMIGNIRMAGTIHDIGKLSVPAEILSKPTKLTDVEFSLIKIHPQTGYDILKDVELPSPIARIVLQHHERIDGSGYPQGLKGEEIILEARIIAVADVVEAIASHRPYRPARGIDAALEEIRKNQGVLYDSAAVDACIRIFEEKSFSFG